MEDEWELKFEHIDWADIADAELSGDHEALQRLMSVVSARLDSPTSGRSDNFKVPFPAFCL